MVVLVLVLMLVIGLRLKFDYDYEHEQEAKEAFAFALHRGRRADYCACAFMGACLSKCIAILASLSLILICSCEKHRVGEMPEVQREHVELAKPGEEAAPAADESKASPAMKASPTPAEFFPPASPSPR
jgi:hypothetical protein